MPIYNLYILIIYYYEQTNLIKNSIRDSRNVDLL